MRYLLIVIATMAFGFSTSADAKGKKDKPRGHVAGPKAGKKPEKVHKKGAKHDLGAVIEAHKRAKGKGKGLEKKDKDGTVAEPAVTSDEAKPGPMGHAWGKSKKFHELSKHLERLAKLERLEEIATAGKNDKLLVKVKLLVAKERKRHDRVAVRIETKASIKDVKKAADKSE